MGRESFELRLEEISVGLEPDEKEKAVERRNAIRATPKGPKKTVMKRLNRLIGQTYLLRHQASKQNEETESK